jgi:hypothetical protein
MSNSCCGRLPAGAIVGARAGKPTPGRYFRMAPGSVRAATTFTVPPQRSTYAELKVEHARQQDSPRQSVASLCRGDVPSLPGESVAWSCTLGPGTMCALSLALGANTPW